MAERPVELYVYDLSRGMARQFSRQMIGIQIDAVYHTSIVVGGKEYYFGHGLQQSRPGSTHHGQPMEIVQLGTTSLPDDVIREYLQSLRSEYSPESYDLFLHNCNNFSADFAMFLCGRSIPDHIKNLPKTVLETPFGQMMRPALEQQLRPITTAHSAPQAPASRPSSGRVHVPTSLAELNRLLDSAKDKCAAIFFTSATCPPCRVVYPHFESLAAESGEKAVFIKVDVGHTRDIGMKYSITATPTFMTFCRGEKADVWSGASPGDLKTNINMLLNMTYPAHPHTNLRLPKLLSTPLIPVTFAKIPPLDKVTSKLGDLVSDPAVSAQVEFLRNLGFGNASEAPLPDLIRWATFMNESFKTKPAEALFPLTDLFRASLADPRVSGFFAEEQDTRTLTSILEYATNKEPPYPLLLTTVQLACNLFTTPLLPPSLLPRIISLLSHALLSKSHATLRVAACSAAFNVAVHVQKHRSEKNEEVVSEEVAVELVAALTEALGEEKESKEMVKAGVLALALISYKTKVGGEVQDLIKALEAGSVVRRKVKEGLMEKGLGDEVAGLLQV